MGEEEFLYPFPVSAALLAFAFVFSSDKPGKKCYTNIWLLNTSVKKNIPKDFLFLSEGRGKRWGMIRLLFCAPVPVDTPRA